MKDRFIPTITHCFLLFKQHTNCVSLSAFFLLSYLQPRTLTPTGRQIPSLVWRNNVVLRVIHSTAVCFNPLSTFSLSSRRTCVWWYASKCSSRYKNGIKRKRRLHRLCKETFAWAGLSVYRQRRRASSLPCLGGNKKKNWLRTKK